MNNTLPFGVIQIAHLGDSWRICPGCRGVEILDGSPVLSPEARPVRFTTADKKEYRNTHLQCSQCGTLVRTI